jgi:hypothetical protein
MYRACLFCNSDLGRNEAVEYFPVGRRLAFDPSRGRLWVVCRKCERWNLTPLEERWEAIEECERAFRGTRLRVSTDEIGLARLREGLELVRIGEPQRPELAAWRYGDQFGRRRRRHFLVGGGVAALAGTVLIAGPGLGLIGAGAVSPVMNLGNALVQMYRSKKLVSVPAPGGVLRTRLADLDRVRLELAGGDAHLGDVRLTLPVVPAGSVRTSWRRNHERETRVLEGDAALRAAGALLPLINRSGGSPSDVQRAVSLVEDAGSAERLFASTAMELESRGGSGFRGGRGRGRGRSSLKRVPHVTRLALEMAAHEESERRALEGELYLLEEAWRDAEEVAAIADDMFLPASIDADLARRRASAVAPAAAAHVDER